MEWITMENFKIILSNAWYLFKVFLRFLPFLIVAIIGFLILIFLFNILLASRLDEFNFHGISRFLVVGGGLLFVGLISGIGTIVNSK